jgi:5-methylcytosine-specific restriction enzyme subunit McrC
MPDRRNNYRLKVVIPRLVLIYPYFSGLQQALPVFDYGEEMQLWVLPFDLDRDHLLNTDRPGLPVRLTA